jgi:formylglycine-generating enzyme required for sulfatase activity
MPRNPRMSVLGAVVLLAACTRMPVVPMNRPALLPGTEPETERSPQATIGVAAVQSPVAGQMAHIPGATYPMGSELGEPDERPVHMAPVSAFDMDLTEVTVAAYAACAAAGACRRATSVVQFPSVTRDDQQLLDSECNDDREDRQDYPVNCVDWTMATAYCRWGGKRLPTEEEWEYAACAGDCDKSLPQRPGAATLARGEHWPFTARVATTQVGAFGLYDMAGNVWEWTSSAYCPYDHPGCGDPRRVVRGGSWSMVDYIFVRLTDRSPSDPTTRNTNLGFRCARSSP